MFENANTLLSNGCPREAEALLKEFRSRPSAAIKASLDMLGTGDKVRDLSNEVDMKMLAAQTLIAVIKHVDVTELFCLVNRNTLSDRVKSHLHVGIALAIFVNPLENWLDQVRSKLDVPYDALSVVEQVAVKCPKPKHDIILGRTESVIELVDSLVTTNHVVAIVRVAKAWIDLASSRPGGEAILLLWAQSTVFQKGIGFLTDPQYCDLFQSFYTALAETSGRTRDSVPCCMQGLNAVCDVLETIPRQYSAPWDPQEPILDLVLTTLSLYEILLPLCANEADLKEVLVLFERQVRSTITILRGVEEAGEMGERMLDLSLILLNLCSTVGEGLPYGATSTTTIHETVWMAVQVAVRYSVLDEQSCCVKYDPTSEMGVQYDQGEEGQARKGLRDALRQCCRAFPGILPLLLGELHHVVREFTSNPITASWQSAEAWVHATTAVTNCLLEDPPSAMAALELMTHPALSVPCRPIHKFAVMLVGKLLPPLLLTNHLGGENEVVSRAMSVAVSSLRCPEEAPRRLGLSEENTQLGAALAFRLKQDHIGIVSLNELLSCPALPWTVAMAHQITAELWHLLVSPRSGTTFKSCLLAAEAVAKALVRSQLEVALLAPLAGAALLHMAPLVPPEMTSNMLKELLYEALHLKHEDCLRTTQSLRSCLTMAKILSLLRASLWSSAKLWPIASRVQFVANLYPFLVTLCSINVSFDADNELFELLAVATGTLSRSQGAEGAVPIETGVVEMCEAGLDQLTDTALGLLETPTAARCPGGAIRLLRTVAKALLSWQADSHMSAFSSLQKLFEQGSLRAIQAIQAPGLELDVTSTQAKVELLTMWREIFQIAPTQLGAQALHDVTLFTCGLLWGQPSNLATAAASPSLANAIFTLLALALQINENARFLVEQSVLPCSKAVWVALSYKGGFAEHLDKVYSAVRSLVRAYGTQTLVKILRLALREATTPPPVVASASAVVDVLCEAAGQDNKKRFRTAAKSIKRVN